MSLRQQPLTLDYSAGFLKAARSGNLDQLLEYLKLNIDVNICNANGLTALHLAAKEGHDHVVSELVRRRANIESATRKGNTPLHIAALGGHEAVVRILVENGANVNAKSQDGFTPLYMAAQENHVEIVKFLLDHSADHTTVTQDGYTPLAVALQLGHDEVVGVLMDQDTVMQTKTKLPALHRAAKKDDVQTALTLIQKDRIANAKTGGGGIVNEITKSGFTPLHIASHYGNSRVGILLIENGADINFKARNLVTPLHVASKWGRTSMVQVLLDSGADINCLTKDGLTALHCAARSGHDNVARLLMQRGAGVMAKTKSRLSPLHMSAQGDHFDCAQLFLRHQAPIDDVTVDYLTPLHVTAHCGSVKTCKLLLDNRCEINARALNGFTPLHVACKKNRIKIIELLLRYGVAIEATTETGLTPLQVAAFMGHMGIVKLLLDNGANPNCANERGETALHLAARGDQTEAMEMLLDNGALVDAKAKELQTALHIAARQGNLAAVDLLLKRGASPNAATKELYTPLHIAVREGHVEIAKRLLDHDANPGLTTKKGFTPLHLAAKHGQMKMIQLLLQRGVDPDIKGRNDLTPLHVGTHYGNPQITTYLMNKGASPVSTTKNGYTPLHIAAKKDHTDIASTLLERGAKPGCESRNGFTPLHLAAKEGHVQMVKLLFGRGADANCRSKNGLTPMHLAAQEDHVPVAELLVKNKAQIDPQTKAGYTPLHTACHFGQINMIQFLLEQGAAVNSTTKQGFTPLHQAAQQGHVMVINLLLRYRANPNAVNAAGQTPLSIAQRLGYLSVIETLSQITTVTVAPSAMTGRYKPVSPETMQEVTLFEMEETKTPNMTTIAEDEEDGETEMRSQTWSKPGVLRSRRPGAAGVSQGSRRSYQDGDEETFRNGTAIGSDTLPPGAFRYLSPEDAQARSASPSYRDESDIFGFDKTPDDRWGSMSFDYHALEDEMKYMSEPLPSAMDELTGQYAGTMPMAVAQQSKSRAPPPEQLEGHATQFARLDSKILTLTRKRPAEDDVPDSREKQPDFLVSFLVDARGGVMEGSRPAGVRLIIPPGSVSKPTRITCRLIRVEKLSSPPLQMEGEALATRILEMGPPGTKFNRPILIDVPHFASLRGREREILVLRCDDGQTWQEHVVPPGVDESDLLAVVKATFEDVESSDELYKKRISRILASDLPQYFALVTRITKETDNIDTHGGAILSANSPKVKVVVPSGAVPRSTKMGLQVQPIPEDIVTKRLSGRETALSPIVTVNPRRRKFNKPLTVMMPLPKKGFTRHAYNNASTLRLLRNSNDGSVPAQWEDVTDSTPLTIMDDTATFSTPTSASFWLVDTPKAGDAARIASELHPEIILVPFMAKFVVCGRRHLPTEARLRVFCMTGDVLERTIRNQGKFAELARSREVEVLNKTPQYLELDGNLAIVDKSGRQPSVFFRALKANGVPIIIRMCEEKQDPTGRLSFMRDPKYTKSRPLQIPICTMNVTLPHDVIADVPGDLEDEEFENRRLGDPDGSQGYSDSSSVGSSIPMSDQELSPEEKAALHKKFDENASDLESEPDYSMGDQNGRIKKQEPSIPEIVLPTSPVKIDFIQEDNAYSSFAKPTNYGPRILTKPEVKEPAVFVSTVPVHAAAKKEPVITHETVDGGTRLVKDAKDKEYKKPDGSTVKERVSTTKHVKTVTEVTLTDGVPTDSQTKEELLLTEIEENIVELPPGVASLMNTNIQTETTEQKTESTLPDGSPVKKKTVRTVGRLKPSVTPRESKPEAKVTGPKVTHETVDGELIPRSKTEESQKTRDDGVTEKLKIVTTQYFKPVTEITFTDGLETDRKSREVLDNTYIEESILELPSGVIAPNADNCDTDISINTSEFAMPDGTPAKKRTVRMIVHLKTVPEKQISVQRTEGDIRSTSEVLEDQENLDSGRKTRKRKLVTTKHFKPITEITFVDGVASDPVMHEEFFGAEVDENILELSAGVIEPYGANCDMTISLENSELPMEEGVVAKKALVTMAVTPKPEKPDTGTSIVEGPITSRTETRQSEGKLSNGGTVRRKIVTTTFLNPIREVTTGDGPPKSRLIREEVVGMDVVENVLELPLGVTEPNGKNITTKTVLTKSEETLPNGKVAKKKVIKTTAEISDENVGPNDQKPVPAKRKGKTTPTKPSDDIIGDDVTRRTVEGEVEPKVDVVEDEERLEEGVIRKRKIVTTRYIKPTFEITIANGMPPEFQKTEEIVDAEIKENILELDYGVVAPNAANCDADILLTHTKTLLPEGVPAKKKTTKITVKLPEDGKQEADAQAKAREARPKESRKLIEGDIERRSTVAEDKQGLSDGGTIKRKIITTKHIKPITEIISKEGKPSKENHWEELVATDIEENILQLPAGIIEPNSSNCDIEVSVDKTQVTLPDGNLANKTSTRMVVTLRDPSKPPKEKRRKRKHGSKGRPDFESEDRDLIEGPVESRTEVKEFEVNRTEGNLIYRVVTTTNVRSILKVSKAGGMEIKTKLREELVSKEIVENVLELPPGVTDINRRDVKTDTTVSSSVEFLPEGVPVKKTVVRTLATLLGKEELAQIPPDSGRVPDVIHKVIEGEIEPRTETEEDEQNLSDGTTIAQKVITTRYVKPITEVKLVKGHPPESTTKEEVVKADVSENILELPCGVIEPYGNNCETDISVAESEVTLPENTPAKKKTTKMIVALLTPSGERIPRITKRLIEGDVESKSSVTEDKEDLNDGGTIWRKVNTTKHIKPITEVTCTDGIPTQTKRWEELVGTDIEENILQLPAGVIEPKASNCDIDVSVDKTQVTLPDGSPASKTVITTVVSLRDPKKPPRGKLRKRKWRPGRKTASKDKPELEDDVIEGPIESRSEVKNYEIKSSSGGLLKYHVVTTTYVKSILKVSKVGGVEKKTKLREELDSRDIVENILELPPGVTDINRRDIKTDTAVTSSSETSPEGVPVTKKVVKTTATLLGKNEIPEITGEADEIPDVVYKSIEGDIEPRIEYEEDEQTLDDGTTVRQNKTTTRYIKPITEVKLVKGSPPESTTKEVVVNAEVAENILELPCGVIEPYGDNCETKVSVTESEVILPDNVPAKARTTRMVVTLKPPSGEKVPKVTKRLIEGDVESKSSVTEDKEDLNDGGTIWRKVNTTKHIKPITEVTCTDGIPTQTKRWEELVSTDIEENILQLPAGVIEPKASNCDIDVSVDKAEVTLPDGSPAKKTIIKTVVTLRDPKKPPRGSLQKRKWKPGRKIASKDKPELEDDVIEGPIESRSEVKDYEIKSSSGGLLKYHVVTTTYVKSILKVSKVGGVERKTKLREELDSRDIVENILELPPGITDINRRDIKTDTAVTSSSETSPEGVPVTKKVVKTTATLLGKNEIPEITGTANEIPDVVYKSIEGEVEPKIEYEEDEKTLDDGTTVRQNKTTTRYIKPITEVKLVKGSPPESTTKEVVVNAEVAENILELPCGVIEPGGDNCEAKVSVTESEVILPDNVPAKAKTTRMVVTLKPPSGEKVPKVTKRLIEGDVESKSSVTEDKEDLNDGGTIWRKITTTKHIKPITEVTCTDGIPTQTKRWEELVSTDIEENILQLPAGVIEPKASNCDIDVSVDKAEVTLPDGSPAKKTIIKTVVTLRDPKKPPRGRLQKRKWKPGRKIASKDKPELEDDVIEGPIESRSEVKDYEIKSSSGGLLKYHVVTTTYVKSILKVSKVGGAEKKTKLREELDSRDIVENILELPPGITDINRRDIKTDTAVTSSSETSPEGVPVTKKVVKTTATLLGKNEIPKVTGEADKIPDVVYKSIEGDIEPRIEFEEDEQTLDDGTTVRQNKTTTRYIKPITEVKLVKGSPPESTTKEVVVNAEVAENILELPCGVIEPYGDNCETKVSVTESEVILPDNVPAKARTTRMVVTLKPPSGAKSPSGEKVPKFTKRLIEGDIESKSSVTEDKEDLNDGGTIWRKVTTTKHVKPVTEITNTDGIPTQTKRWEELVGTDIEENVLQLPVGVIEPNSSNCDINVTADKSQVTLPDGSLANKTLIKTVVNLREPFKPPREKGKKRKYKPSKKSSQEGDVGRVADDQQDIIEGPVESRTEVKEYEVKAKDGGLVKYRVVTTSNVKTILKVSKAGGIERKTKLREELDSREIVENILELPPGVTDVNRRDVKTDTTVSSSEETLPEGVPVTKKVVKTTATLLRKGELPPEISKEMGEIPEVVNKVVEGDIEPRIEIEEDEQNLPDGSTVRQTVITTKYVKPITEVKLVSGLPPESTTKEEVLKADVSENILELPCGVIEPHGENCETEVSTEDSKVTLPDNIPADKKTTRTTVALKPSRDGEGKIPKITKKLQEGDLISRIIMAEEKENRDDGSTVLRKTVTVKHFKPFTDTVSKDGVPVSTTRWEELVGTDIEENVLQLPAGVIEPNSSNCDIDVSVDKFEVTLPDGGLANKTLITTVVTLRDPSLPPRAKRPKRKRKSRGKSVAKGKDLPEVTDPDIIEGPLESRTEVKEYELKANDGGLLKYRVVTTTFVRTILKLSKVGGLERKTKLREELDSKEIVENVLELPPGVTDVNSRGVKTETTVTSSEETLPEGVPIVKKIIKTVASLLTGQKLTGIPEELGKVPAKVTHKVIEGEIESRIEVEEDEQNLNDGTTIKQTVVTTRYVQPITEVKLVSGSPPESTTREEIQSADVSENILELPCGVIDPFASNCDRDITVSECDVTLPEGTAAKKRTTRMIVQLRPSQAAPKESEHIVPVTFAVRSGEPKFTRRVLEGEVDSRSEADESQRSLEDGSTVTHRVVTTTYFKPITEIVSVDGIPTEEKHSEEHVGTDIDENIVQLPAGVVEPNASNCDIDVSVDKSLVPLPDGILANKTVTRMIVRLRDATKPPRERLRKRKWKPGKKVATGKGKTSRKSETEQGDIIEGPIESRTDVKEYEVNEKDGSLVKYRVVTTTNVKSILKLTKTGGIERRTKLREELDSKDIVENILELPPGVTDVNRNDVKTDTTVSSSSETLPEGVPVTRKIVRTTASLLAEPDVTAYEEPTETPGFIVKVIEGKIEPKREVEEDEKNLGDGRTLRQVVVTTKYVKPVTEVRLTSDGPPESTTREEIVDAEVSENILDLPCGIIEPNESNCNKDISVKKSEVTLPEGVPAKKKTTTVVVQLQPVGSVKADAPPKRTDKPSEVTRKILEGEVQSKSVITEDQEALDDGGTVKRKIITTTRIKPITEILLQDGLPLETKHREEIVGTDIEENVLKLPCGVIEPNAANCVADLSVDSFEVLLKDGTLAKKVLVMMVVKLKDDSLDAVSPVSDAKKLQALADLEASKNILEGPIQSRVESKQYEETSDTGGSVHCNVVTTTYFKPVLEVTVENGIEKRRLLREDVVSIEVVENILELPPGVTELDSRTTESETSVNLTEESLPNGVPVKKRVVKTVATVPKKPLAADPEQPNIVHRVIDGEVKPVSEVVDFQDNLDDGTAIKRKVTTTRQVKPVTEVKLTKGHPPESTTREETVASDVKEHVLELPCGTIEPNAENCDIDISVDNVEDVTPENVPCTKTTTKMTVKLKPPVAETFPQTSRRIVEGEVEARSTVQEFKENLDNGAMAKHKIITTKYIKPITEIVSSDGLTVETKDREELVKTEIEENILQLPAGVIEPNASNCEADISVNTSDVALPDGSLARKTVTKVVIQLKDELLLGEEEAPQLMAGRLLPTKRGEETRTVDGEITTKTDTKEDVEKTSDGAVIKRNIITMTHSRPTILISNVGGKETRTTLKELVVGVDIVENILTLLPGVTDPNEEGVKTDTSLKKFHETLPGGVPVNKEVIKTIAFLVRKQPEKEKEAELWPQDISEVPDVTQRILEGPVQAKSEVKEDQKNLDDGRTIKQKEITTRYVKPVTEVILVDDCPPESTTKEELVGGDVKQIVLDLQCGRIEPFAANCDTDISVENTSTVLPENLSVPKKVIRMTVHLVEPTQEGRDYTEGTGKQRISHRVVEGKITPKSTTKEDEETSFDGTVIRRKVITTQFFKSITDITLVDDVQTDSQTRDELVETIIDETVLQLSPGVIEPDASNCESDISFENSQVTLPDGTLAKKRLVRIVVQIRKEAESGATRTKVIEGPVELRPKLFKDEKKLGDGSTVRRKVTTTRHIQPIIEVVLVNGIETSSHLREEKLILTEIEENILQLPPGVKDVSGNNVQTKTTVKDFEDASPDGSPIKRKVIKTVATVGDQPRPGATEQVAGPRTAEVIEGSIQTRTTVREDQRNLDDGVIRKEKVVTTVHFRPITEVILSEGSAPDSQVREELIKTVIDECILELPAGVIMPFAENCNTEIKVENFEYGLPGEAGYSTPCSKKVVQMIVTLKKEFQPAAGSREALRTGMKPDLQDNKLVEGQTVKLVEGEVESRTKVAEEQENLPNGVTLKRKLITTTFIKPVTEIVLVNGREIERHSREVTVGVDKEEHILELPSGVVEPYASNCDTDISVTNSQEQLPDGIVANKKVVKITVRLKPDYEKPDKSKAVGKRVAEGPVQPRIRVEEKQETKDDGTRVKSTVTTTEHIKSVTETPVVDGVEMESETREQLVSTEIVADIVELLPSVTEPYDDRTTDSNVTVKRSEEVSPDGLPIKKTTTTTTVAPKTRLSPSRVPTAKEVTHKTVKGELRSQTTVAEDKKDLDDGSSIRRKVLTTVYIMPITELTLVNGKETEASTRDEIVSAEIEEHVLQLPAGLIEPHADNCDIDISFKHFDESLPDGTPAKRKVVSTIVRLKVDASRRLESQRAIEGEVRTVRDVKEDERVTGDGRTIRTRTITTKWLKPVTDVALVNGVEVKSKTREVVVATEIEENIIELPPNVKDECRSDLQSRTSVEQDEVVLPDGTVAKRKTTRTVFTEPAEQIPLVKHTLLEGPVESRKTETQDQQNTDDGKTIRRKVITTKHVKPVTDITLVNGTPTESSTKDVLLGVDIEEHILQLPPGVIEPFGSNCDTEISVDNSEEALEEGVVAKKKIVTMVVSLKPQDREIEVFSPVRPTRLSDTQLSPDDRLRPFGDREHSVGRTYERPVEVRKKVTEDQQNLEDGGTLRRKVITTDYVKPIWKVRVIDGKEKESFVRDEVIDTKIEEHILQLPPGVIEPFGSNCETDISVESTEVTLADGRVAKKKIVKMIVFLKGSEQEKVAEKRVSVTEEKPASAEKDFTGIPHISHRLEEGPIASLVKVTESQQILEDGSTVRRKVITTKFVRTVTDITLIDGVETSSETREENIRTEIEEITLKLPAGVIEPYGSNLETDTTVDQFDDTLPDGTPAKKKLVTIVVRLKDSVLPEKKDGASEDRLKQSDKSVSATTPRPSLSDAESQVGSSSYQEDLEAKRRAKAAESAGVVHKVIEGAVSTTTEVKEDETCLEDGTTIRTKIVTTRHYKPVTKLVITDGLVSDATMAEETVKTEIDENILELPPGVTDPKGDDLQTDTTVRTFQETLFDGSMASRKVTKRVITVKPGFRRSHRDAGHSETEQDIVVSQASTTFRKPTQQSRTGADSPDSRTSRDASMDSKSMEMTSVYHRVVSPPQQTHTDRTKVHDSDDSDPNRQKRRSQKSSKDTRLLTVSKPTVTKRVTTKIRRVGPDGEIFEDMFTDEEDLSEVTSPTSAIADFHDLASPTLVSPADSDVDNPAIRVYTDTVETEPVIDRQVQEFEDTLPDGTVVKRRLIRTTQKKTIIKRVVMEGPEDDLAGTSEEQVRQMLPLRPSSTEPQLTKYTDVTKQEPETSTDFKEYDEIMPDGTVVKKRVKTTTQQKLTTERMVLGGKLDDNALREIFKDDGHAKALPAAEGDAKPDQSKASKRSQAEERSSRLMLRKQVHKRTVVEPGREETVITDETLVDRSDEEPEELRDSIRDVIRELVGSSSGSSGDESM